VKNISQQMQDLIDLLHVFGFSDKEKKILHACMRFEGTRASEISKITGIERTNVYKILEVLISKGYVSMYRTKNLTFYRSLEPKALLEILKNQAQEFEKNLAFFESNYNSSTTIPRIEVFSGRKAVSQALTLIIKKGKDYSAFGGIEQAYRQNYLENIPSGLLAEEAKTAGRVILAPSEKTVILSNEKYKVSNKGLPENVCTIICDDLLAIFNWGDHCNAIFIKDQNIVQDYLATFENLWFNSKSIAKSELSKKKLINFN
jgi:sugar-specific transcriptional regulator TrmB